MQHKVFRVERMFNGHAVRPEAAVTGEASGRKALAAHADGEVQALRRELFALQEICARNRRELAALINDGHERRLTHAASKLGAAVEGMEKATVKILRSTEAIDESAKALAATLRGDYERGLAQDIQDHVIKIYEACNFQDLAGQRIGNVIATLNFIEERLTTLLDPGKQQPSANAKPRHGLLNGPRLDGASGHTSQSDIDALFG